VLTLVLTLVAGGVEVAPGTPCVSREGLVERLEAAGTRLPAGASLTIAPSGPEALLARYVVKGVTLERRVPAPAQDCDAVLRVVTALVQAWVTTPPRTAAGRDAGLSPASDSGRGDGGLTSGRRQPGASGDGGAPEAPDASGPDADAGGITLRASSPVREAGPDAGAAIAVSPFSPNGDARSRSMNRAETDGGTAATVGSTNRGQGDGGVLPTVGSLSPTGDGGSRSANREEGDGGSAPTVGSSSSTAETGVRSANPPRADAGAGEPAARSTNPMGTDAGLALPSVRNVGIGRSSSTDGRLPDVVARGDAGIGSTEIARMAPDAGAPDGPRLTATSTTAPDAGEPPPSPRWTFGAGLFGGIASGATSQVLPTGAFTLDATRGRFGAALDVGLSRETTAERSPGAVASSWQWLSISARLAIPLLERLLLEVQLGVRGYRVTARASGFEVVSPEQVLLSVGAVGSVGVSFRVVGPLGVSLRLVGNTRRPEAFLVEGLGSVLETGAFEGGALAGLVARF
jgi:hypothetical protein